MVVNKTAAFQSSNQGARHDQSLELRPALLPLLKQISLRPNAIYIIYGSQLHVL
jgi:hypothetical protein